MKRKKKDNMCEFKKSTDKRGSHVSQGRQWDLFFYFYPTKLE